MTQAPPIRESPDAQRPAGLCGLSEMIYGCFEQVAHLSEASTLEPGGVIATGTSERVVEGPEGYLVPEAGREAAWVH